MKKYIHIVTGYSDECLDKLIREWKDKGRIIIKERTQHSFRVKYSIEDIYRIVDVSNLYDNQNARAMKEVFRDMYYKYGDDRFMFLKDISVSHIYNLKKTEIFKSNSLTYTKTSPSKSSIGERVKPNNQGKPGYLRVDSVHQGDKEKEKGIYHITVVDEVTQITFLACVPYIREEYVVQALRNIIDMFPYPIINFHSDNGSEYINRYVSDMLNKSYIHQTKSRARHSGDNGLVESKNGSIVRKQMGYLHIPSMHAYKVNEFYKNYLNHFNNYHRVSAYSTDKADKRGKIKKIYINYMTPIDKLLSLNLDYVDNDTLRKKQKMHTHLEYAFLTKEAKSKLFKEIFS